jgi:hypothetical protein
MGQLSMIDHLLPFALINPANPVFRFDLRQKRWPRDPEDLIRYSRDVILSCLFLFGVFWCILLGSQGRYGGSSSTANTTATIVLFATAGIALASDFYCAIVTVGGLHRQLTSGDWDLLRLTGQREEDIFRAKLAVAQIRAWRMMSIETAIHAIGAELAILSATYSWLTSTYRRGNAVEMYLIVAITGLMAFYIIEPFWKMRAVVGLGMAVSAQVQNLTFAVLGALGAVFTMRLLEGLLLGALFYLLLALARFARSDVAGMCLITIFVVAVGFSLRFFYRMIAGAATRRAFKKLFQVEWSTL